MLKRGKITLLLILTLSSISCEKEKERTVSVPVDWGARTVDAQLSDSLEYGSTYLSTYSEIYTYSEEQVRYLTSTISLKNINKSDTVFILKIEYFNTHGTLIKSYIEKSIFIAPMETVEIVIGQSDKEGGSGANFIFEWSVKPGTHEPLFEGIMVSLTGNQAFSFVTLGKRIE